MILETNQSGFMYLFGIRFFANAIILDFVANKKTILLLPFWFYGCRPLLYWKPEVRNQRWKRWSALTKTMNYFLSFSCSRMFFYSWIVVERVWIFKTENTRTTIPNLFLFWKFIFFLPFDFVGTDHCFIVILNVSRQRCKWWSALTKTMHNNS